MSFRDLIKKILPRSSVNLVRKLIYPEKINLVENDLRSLFKTHYDKLAAPDLNQRIAFLNHEFKIYSKYGNDGLLFYLFSLVGAISRTFVEIGVEDGKECNTASLSLDFGWQGAIIDADEVGLEKAGRFYREKLGDRVSRVKIIRSFVTAENINELMTDNGIRGEVDLLSIDIDGNDYWVWKAISVINPRVVVMEYNASFGFDRSVTMKYKPDFDLGRMPSIGYGASLAALTKLADAKGYMLVACESHGIDAFFVRKDLAQGKFIGLMPQEAWYPHFQRTKIMGSTEKQYNKIKYLDFEHV
jgi:hypothetical protein